MDLGGAAKRHKAMLVWTGALVVLAVVSYFTTPDPEISHSSALNAVFDSRWLVAGARLLLGVTLVYLLLSIGVRIKKRQWVRSAGPVETDASAAQDLADDQKDLQQQLKEAKDTIDDLTKRLDRSLEARQSLLATVTKQPESGKLEGSGEGSEATS